MDEVNKIRKAFFEKDDKKNRIAKDFNRSWATVDSLVEMPREALASRGKRNRKPTVITPDIVKAINDLLDTEEMLQVRKKQRYTAEWIYNKLSENGVYKGKSRTLRDAVSDIRKMRTQSKDKSFLPLEFVFGSTIQIDHGEAEISLNGQRISGYLFVAQVPGAAIRYCQFYLMKSMEAWGAFHERTFLFFQGIFPAVTYDNDSVLVKKVIGRERNQTSFSHNLEEHYGFTSRFCNKGAGNEKGAVENGVGFCRRNYLAGVQEFKDTSQLNQYLEGECREFINKNRHYKTADALSALYLQIKERLQPMTSANSWVKWEDVKVNRYQTASYLNHGYSVPERYAGADVRLAIGAEEIKIYQNHELIAVHPRQFIKGGDSLYLDHYLDQLRVKPGALWDCKAVRSHMFEPELLQYWERLKNRLELSAANKEFIKVLLLRRQYSQAEFMMAIGFGLEYGAIEYASLANILKQLTNPSPVYPGHDWLAKNLPHIAAGGLTWEIDLSQYAELTKEAAHVN